MNEKHAEKSSNNKCKKKENTYYTRWHCTRMYGRHLNTGGLKVEQNRKSAEEGPFVALNTMPEA